MIRYSSNFPENERVIYPPDTPVIPEYSEVVIVAPDRYFSAEYQSFLSTAVDGRSRLQILILESVFLSSNTTYGTTYEFPALVIRADSDARMPVAAQAYITNRPAAVGLHSAVSGVWFESAVMDDELIEVLIRRRLSTQELVDAARVQQSISDTQTQKFEKYQRRLKLAKTLIGLGIVYLAVRLIFG